MSCPSNRSMADGLSENSLTQWVALPCAIYTSEKDEVKASRVFAYQSLTGWPYNLPSISYV